MRNAGPDGWQSRIKTAKWNDNLRYADDTTLMAESEEEIKNLLMKVKEESEKADLKLVIQKTKIMASGPITYGTKKGKKWKKWQILFFWAPKTPGTVMAAMKLKETCFLEGELWQTRECIKKQRHD